MIKVNASKLELCVACPAAPARNIPFPFVESDASMRGKDLHERTSLLLQDPDIDFEELCEGLPDEDKTAIKTCTEVAGMLLPKGKRIIFIEEKLDLKFLSMTYGIPDLAYYDKDSETIAVVDWKFGKGQVPDPSNNYQLMAYALALTNKLKEEDLKVKQAYLVICQPCGTAKQSYRDITFPASMFPEWEKEIKDAIEIAQEKDAPAIPGTHCRRCFCEAGKNDVCPEFKEYAQHVREEKEEQVVRKAQFATSGVLPVVIQGPGPAFPLVVISEEAITKANDYCSKASGLVADQHTANQMGLLLNEITKFEGQVVKSTKEVKKPLDALYTAIDEARDRALIPLKEAKVKAKERLDEWVRGENEKAKEEAKKAQEAIDARLKAEQEAEDAKQRLASPSISQEEAEKAEQVLFDAQHTLRTVEVPQAVQAPVKVAGVKIKQVPEYEITDFAKVPDMYKIIDEKMLKTAIEQEKVTEKDGWLKIRWVDKTQSSGRK